MNEGKTNLEKCEDILPKTVAFILCHPINSSFVPISKELPQCLFPLCNIPVLFYVIQWLNNNNIKKMYIVCQESDKKPIQKITSECEERLHLKSIELLVPENNYSINSIASSIKWIYSSSSIVTNFENCIIVPGTIVTNIPLKNILEETKDKSILTTIFTKSSSNGYSIIVNNENYLLQLNIPSQFDFETTQNTISNASDESIIQDNLNDSLIYIVTPEFLSIFSSFNDIGCDSIMNDCVPSLIDHEKEKKSVLALVLSDCYSSDICSIQNYMNSSLAVIDNILSPFTIDSNFMSPSKTYTHLYDEDSNDEEEDENNNKKENSTTSYHVEKDSVYVDKDVVMHSSSVKMHHCVVGNNSSIDDNCLISNSTIGSDCKIGKGVIIKNCIIWDRVIIEDGVQINNSVIASDCTIKKDIKIDFGSIISFNVIVDIDLPPCRRLIGYENEEKENEFNEDNTPDWVKNYINNKKPLKTSDDINYVEFIPPPESEIHLLNLWFRISPNSFPIDMSKIGDNQENDDNIEEESNETDEEFEIWEKK